MPSQQLLCRFCGAGRDEDPAEACRQPDWHKDVFVEPAWDAYRGMGPTLLPFDFW